MNANNSKFSRSLDLKDLIVIATGQIVGAGLFSLLPAAIGITGKAASIAFIVAAVMTCVNLIPRLLIFSTVRFEGGDYSSIAFLVSKKLTGTTLLVHILARLSFAMYALTFAEYFIASIFPLDTKFLAIGILTVFFVTNLIGIKQAARLQMILMIVLISSMIIFVFYGIPKVDANYFSEPFFSDGIFGMFQAAALLMFATGGADTISNLSGECKRPTRDLPIAMIISTLGVAIVYGAMAVVASGVLPVSEVANKPLSLVANNILPTSLYYYFIVGGAMFAILTTINSQFASAPQLVVQAVEDGWLPKKFGEINQKFKTPHYVLSMFYLISVLAIIADISIAELGNIVVILVQVLVFALMIGMLRLPKVFPEDWQKSAFYVSSKTMSILTFFVVVVAIVSAYMNLYSLTPFLGLLNVIVVIVAIMFGVFGYKALNIKIHTSYESENK